MKKLVYAFTALSLLIAFFTSPTSAYAWLVSDTYNVKVDISFKPRWGIMPADKIDCKSATLTVAGKTYTASVSNPWLSNKCSVTFSKVKVVTSGTYYVTVGYKDKAVFKNYQQTFGVSLSRPLMATLTRSVTLYD